jgi:hypothetical protein
LHSLLSTSPGFPGRLFDEDFFFLSFYFSPDLDPVIVLPLSSRGVLFDAEIEV